MKLGKVRDQYGLTKGAENVDPIEKVLVIDGVTVDQVFERHLHQHYHVFTLYFGLLNELCGRALQHVDRDFRDRAKAASLHDDAFLVEHVGGLHHRTVRKEHRGLGQAFLNELK